MSAQLYVASERPDLWERAYDQIVGVWPTYNEQGDVLGRHWSRLDKDFADFQLVLYDEEADLALAHGHSIPCRWDGTVEGLGDGIDEVMEGAVRLLRRRRRAEHALRAGDRDPRPGTRAAGSRGR